MLCDRRSLHRLLCVARSLLLYVAYLSVRYSGYRCIARSLFRSVALLSFLLLTTVATGALPALFSIADCCGYRCIARSLSPVARLPLPAAPATVYCPLSFSFVARLSSVARYSSYRCIACSLSLRRASLISSYTGSCVLPALSFSTSRVSPLGTPAPGALPAPFFSTSHVYRCSGYRCVTGFFGRVGFF